MHPSYLESMKNPSYRNGCYFFSPLIPYLPTRFTIHAVHRALPIRLLYLALVGGALPYVQLQRASNERHWAAALSYRIANQHRCGRFPLFITILFLNILYLFFFSSWNINICITFCSRNCIFDIFAHFQSRFEVKVCVSHGASHVLHLVQFSCDSRSPKYVVLDKLLPYKLDFWCYIAGNDEFESMINFSFFRAWYSY